MSAGKQSPIWLVLIIALPVLGWQGLIRYWKHREEKVVVAKQEAARADIVRAKKSALERLDEARAAIVAAHASPPSAAGACPIKVPAPPPMNGKAKTSFDNANEAVNAALGGQAFLHSMTLVRKQDLSTVEPARAKNWLRDASSLESQLSSSTVPDDFVASAQKLANEKLTWDLVVVVDKQDLSTVDEEKKTFKPGTLQGAAYLYDYESRAVVCSAAVDVENSDSVSVQLAAGSVYTTLMLDLHAQALSRAAERLAAVQK